MSLLYDKKDFDNFILLMWNLFLLHLHYVGEKLVNFLVEPKKGTKWPSKLPRFANRHEAIAVCKELCKSQYLLRSEKRGKGELDVRSRSYETLCVCSFASVADYKLSFRVLRCLASVILMRRGTLHGYMKVIRP